MTWTTCSAASFERASIVARERARAPPMEKSVATKIRASRCRARCTGFLFAIRSVRVLMPRVGSKSRSRIEPAQ
jgi:hypothetical protein